MVEDQLKPGLILVFSGPGPGPVLVFFWSIGLDFKSLPAVYCVADVTWQLREGETGIKYGNKLALGCAKNEQVQPKYGLPRSKDAVDGAGPVLITLEQACECFD